MNAISVHINRMEMCILRKSKCCKGFRVVADIECLLHSVIILEGGGLITAGRSGDPANVMFF